MKQLRLFRKTIAFGYLLIAVLIGSIAYTSFYEWRRLESLEEENRQISHFRQQIHDTYEQMIEFFLLGETILKWEPKDLEKWGYIPELLGRIGSFFVMNPMSEDLMVEVLTSASENNIIHAHVNQCAQYGIALKIEGDAIRHIASKAMEMKLGFRAVRSILGDIMQPIYFDCDKYKGKKLLVDWDFIKDNRHFKS